MRWVGVYGEECMHICETRVEGRMRWVGVYGEGCMHICEADWREG